jgi:hypothetical protein
VGPEYTVRFNLYRAASGGAARVLGLFLILAALYES